MSYVIVDCRMRVCEKVLLKELGFEVIEVPKCDKVYSEISSHVDIFTCKIDDNLIIERSIYDYFKEKIVDSNINIIER